MNENILISGGSGFLGSHLIPLLKSNGKKVAVLSRKIIPSLNSYLWNPEKHTIDLNCFNGTGTIIHLAGAGIADKRWTESYKKEIIESRVKSAGLLFDKLRSNAHSVHTIISASAVGYYGHTNDVWVDEGFHAPEDFMGSTCIEWEKSIRQFETLGIRVVIFRIGLVLDKKNGILPVISKPVKWFAGAPLGNGSQYMSWIHIDDLCRLFLFATGNKNIHGVFNAVATGPVTNKIFMQKIAKALHRPLLPVGVPAFLLKLFLGEKADMVLNGQRVTNEKIRMAGFSFQHTDLDSSLSELLS
jgi:uncharacterized protein (TIGR01777 family)